MSPTFTSNSSSSVPLWGAGTSTPHNWDKFSDSAKQTYKSNFVTAAMVGCNNKEAHSHGMKAVKQTHKLKNGKWEPK